MGNTFQIELKKD